MLPELFMTAVDFTTLPVRPEAFTIPAFTLAGSDWGPFSLRWYSLAYIAGIAGAWVLLTRMIRPPGAPLNQTQLDDYITWATLGVIGGGRLGYVIFYNPAQYLADPISILRLWDGGMSFHGGCFGVIAACFLHGWFAKFSGLRLLDYVATVTPLGLGLGRLANFVNGELWGRPTGSDWGIIFPEAGPEPRHPSQLYEAGLEGGVLFLLLTFLFWRTGARLRPGLLSGVFGLGYGLSRTIVENYREPDRQLGILDTGLTMGQTLSLPLIAAALLLLAVALLRKPVVA
ncbi:prolipoprotein diacylglyceryl transferase [Sandarakinorhabdus rubra]|uniref:prolipoprotein diacylglyceryl transferase n=1 Tax=Sandarakinorhabdus rubra TaxID=2672568 RepID=UPI0013D8F1CB|nr:prolipoprotein diacylglyceryl transferase [Sandarakinorhabdus rubra]